jgi:citronellyl-CoA dehydrogenase
MLPRLPFSAVMPGLVPGIHVFLSFWVQSKQDVDGRDKPGHDAVESVCP